MQKWNAYSAQTKIDMAIGVASSKYAVGNPVCYNSPDRVSDNFKVSFK